MVSRKERIPTLIDFGTAKETDTGGEASHTKLQKDPWKPETSGPLKGQRRDIYALGQILRYLLTKEEPSVYTSSEHKDTEEKLSQLNLPKSKQIIKFVLKATTPELNGFSNHNNFVEELNNILHDLE